MCGIAGIINPQPVTRAENNLSLTSRLEQMSACIQHRGPDGKGIWINPAGIAGLAHRRLSIIDLTDAAAQPMYVRGIAQNARAVPRYTIVHNGEIYNYLELRKDLQAKGYSFQSASDTEIIGAAYDHYKEDCVDHFDGMYAFAVWDEEEQELFVARDRFGEKPFYYFFDGRQFVFASEIKALWAAGVERRPNLQMLFNFLTIGYTDNPGRPEETFFENILRLPAASILYYNAVSREVEVERYWDIDLSIRNKTIGDEEASSRFMDLFSASVKKRLRSDVSIGTSLSGGLDSSSVVATAASIDATRRIQDSFTAIFPGFDKDESAYAGNVSNQFGLMQHKVGISASDLVNDWTRFLVHQEEPFGSASAYAQYKVFEAAKESDVKVLLDGQGADEILAGYGKYYKWYWQELFQKRKLVKSRELKAAKEMGIEEAFGFKNIVASLLPEIASVVLERRYLVHALQHPDLTKEFVRLQSKEAYYSTPPNFNLNGILYFNTCIHGLEELLRLADRNSMAHGREVRLPFLSHELVEFIFSLPPQFKIHKAWTKWLLRVSMVDRLPTEIVWRKEKVGFEPPQKEWMNDKRVQELIYEGKKKLVEEKILKKEVLERPIVPASAHDEDGFEWRYLSAGSCLW